MPATSPARLSAEQSANALAARSLDDPGLRDFLDANLATPLVEWPLTTWDIESLTLAAYYFHPDLDVARAQWAVALAGQRTAGQLPNPTISAAPALNLGQSNPSPWLVTASIDVPIETAGKRRHRQAQAAGLSEKERLGIASAAWKIHANVRTALVELHATLGLHSLLATEETLRSQMLRILDAQFDAGAAAAFEVTQLRIAAHNDRLALREMKREVELARARLATTMDERSIQVARWVIRVEHFHDSLCSPVPDGLPRIFSPGRLFF